MPFLIGGALGIPLGAEVLRWATPAQMRAFVGLALVLFSVYSLARPRLPIVKGGWVADAAVGVISGFLGGSTRLAGIPVIVWATLCGWSKDEQRATFQPVAVAIFDDARLVRCERHGYNGHAALVPIGLPAVLLGTWLGFKLYGKLHDTMFRTIVLVLLLTSGLRLLPSTIMSRN